MWIVDREPRSSKWRSIHARARSDPNARSSLRNTPSVLSLLAAPRSRSPNFPSSMSFVMKATARISRMSEELKLISSTRFMISRALVGLSGRSIGLTCTMRMSRDVRRAFLLPHPPTAEPFGLSNCMITIGIRRDLFPRPKRDQMSGNKLMSRGISY
jgi:hypothetical protein